MSVFLTDTYQVIVGSMASSSYLCESLFHSFNMSDNTPLWLGIKRNLSFVTSKHNLNKNVL